MAQQWTPTFLQSIAVIAFLGFILPMVFGFLAKGPWRSTVVPAIIGAIFAVQYTGMALLPMLMGGTPHPSSYPSNTSPGVYIATVFVLAMLFCGLMGRIGYALRQLFSKRSRKAA